MTLFNQGADVIAFHTASPAVMVAAQERGKLAIGYPTDMRAVARTRNCWPNHPSLGRLLHAPGAAVLDGSWRAAAVPGGGVRGHSACGEASAACPRPCATVLARQRDDRRRPAAALRWRAADIRDNQGRVVVAVVAASPTASCWAWTGWSRGVRGSLPARLTREDRPARSGHRA